MARPLPARILIVDDDPEIRELLCSYLEGFGMHAQGAADARELRSAMARESFDLILLDLMLPGQDGLSLCREIRRDSDVPIVMVTGRGEASDRIVGLELGADDYIVKPFDERELVARIGAVLRRGRHRGAPRAEEAADIAFGGWRLNTVMRQLVDAEGVVVPLSNAEFRLLLALLERPRRVLSRDQLIDLARGSRVEVFDRSIDILVSRLRQKLRDDPKQPQLIRTVRGEGYLLDTVVER
jgi:two-component system, OmpR family, response regulator